MPETNPGAAEIAKYELGNELGNYEIGNDPHARSLGITLLLLGLTYLSHLLFGLIYLSHSHQIVCVDSIPDAHVQQDNLMLSDRAIARPKKENGMDVRTDERFLRDIKDYLMELAFNVESIDEVNLIADVLISVQDVLRDLAQKPRSSA